MNSEMKSVVYRCYIVYAFLTFLFSGFSQTQGNTAPVFTNLPSTNKAGVLENSLSGTSVFQVSYTDADGDTVTFSRSSSPTDGDVYFGIDAATGLVSTIAEPIDYETLSTFYDLQIVASDGTDVTTATVTVEILDVNEPPTFTQSAYGTTAAEGQVQGTTITNPGLAVTDPDVGDTYICLLDCGAGNTDFTMATDCTLTFSGTYSLDTGDTSPVVCTVSAVDNGGTGNTANTTLTITITDVNNYDPQFTLPTYTFVASIYDAVGTSYTTVTATDGDAGTYGDVVFTLDQTAYTRPYFQVDSSSGVLTLANNLSSCACTGTTITVPALATDTGGRTDTATLYVSVLATTTAATATTTDRYLTFLEDTRNVAWLSALIVLLVIVVGIELVICCKYIPNWPKDFWRNASTENYYRNMSRVNIVEPVQEIDMHQEEQQDQQQPQKPMQTHIYSVMDEHNHVLQERCTMYSVARKPPPHTHLQSWRM